jgi:hypothetical protein
LRAFAAVTTPALSTFGPPSTVTGIALAGVGVQAATNGIITNARVDIAGLKFKTPADTSDGTDASLSLYFGYLGATGTWDSNLKTGGVTGVLAEIATSLSSIMVWYDRNGQAGFQWDLAAQVNIYDCATGGTNDCVDLQGAISMKDLTWTFIERNVTNCSAVASGYNENCTIHTLQTKGRKPVVGSSTVITITARTASQPIMINGILHTPDKAKFDVQIDYPWGDYTLLTALKDAPKAKLALVAFHAGKVAAGAAVATIAQGAVKGLAWGAAGGKAAYFSYASTATIDASSTTITTKTVAGAEVLAAPCATGSPCATSLTGIILLALKASVTWLQGFGWSTQMTIHAFSSEHPLSIFWDPEVGVTGYSASAGVGVAPSVALAMVLAFVFH